ncbi:hypothetical protein ACHAW6_001135 [Cyclotella cf. meneghiniana]
MSSKKSLASVPNVRSTLVSIWREKNSSKDDESDDNFRAVKDNFKSTTKYRASLICVIHQAKNRVPLWFP